MTKKNFPGLVLVPPSDRTIVRRRIVRWSLVGLAILWGMFTFLSSLTPSNKSDCQPVNTQTSPSTGQEDCNPATASVPQSQPRLEETSPVTEAPPNTNPLEGQNSLTPMSEQTTGHPSSASSSADRNDGTDHTGMVQPEMKAPSTQPPYQPTQPHTTADHQAATQPVSGPAPQHPIPSSHTSSGGKLTAQPENGSAPPPGLHQPAKSTNSSADHRLVAHAPKETATQPIPPQPTKVTTTNADHKPTGQPGSGTVPNQISTKPKATIQPGNGTGQPQPLSQQARSVNTSSDHKQTAQPHNGSVPHQTSPQAVNPKPSASDRKVTTQPGNGSMSSPHLLGNANSVAGQSGNGASHNPSPSPHSHEDTRLAEAGDAFAQYRLGRLYAQQGGSQIPEAVRWYKKASNGLRHLAESGNGQAMYVLGVMYAYGRGVKKDADQARHWLSQAVSHKITAARPILASLEKDRSVAHTTQ